ncbi:hypothetical protein LTS08_007093 [Lithohypha guttulata]|nr:hypothetical protein LTS08_007093 [Lithohypha guttulata]
MASRRYPRTRRGGLRGGFHLQSRHSVPLPVPELTQRKIEDVAVPEKIEDDLVAKINGVEYVASYDLTDGLKAPTILVPGKPPRWTPPSQPQNLHEDSDVYYRDPNSARHHKYPTEPAVRAVLHQHTDFAFSTIDIFGCGSTFGSLLSFVRNEERTFRFGVDRVGSTTFLVRKTNTPGEIIEDVRGYGHTFPEAYTTWESDVRASASYQRIIKYNFAGLSCVIRSESDGYLPDKLEASHETLRPVRQDESLLNGGLSSLGLGLLPLTSIGPLVIEDAGDVIPQQAIFDLKTRSINQKERLGASTEEFLPRLWANQTPNFVLAFHKWGKFQLDEIHIKDVRDDVKAWEAQNVDVLSRLGKMYHKIVDLSSVHGRFEVRRIGAGPLEIWTESTSWSALPKELREQFCGEHGSEVGDNGLEATHVNVNNEGDDDSSDDEKYLRF